MCVSNVEVYAAWKVLVCLSTSACQQTTEAVCANLAILTTFDIQKILNHKKDFSTGPLGLEATINKNLSIVYVH